MFDHVTIRVTSREASERFYDTVLRTLGIEPTHSGDHFAEWDEFSLAEADGKSPVTRRLHVGFAAPTRAHVDEFWRTGVAAGYESDGEPGLRPQYSDDYYGAFLLDPDGNSVEAVHHGSLRNGGNVDHLWIRVSDVHASTHFYEIVGPAAGFRVGSESADRTQFACVSGSFSVVAAEEPSEHVHLAFAAADNETVDRFHREATAAGYRDNGAPGERSVYHEGYYAAFVLDPDGNRVTLVPNTTSARRSRALSRTAEQVTPSLTTRRDRSRPFTHARSMTSLDGTAPRERTPSEPERASCVATVATQPH